MRVVHGFDRYGGTPGPVRGPARVLAPAAQDQQQRARHAEGEEAGAGLERLVPGSGRGGPVDRQEVRLGDGRVFTGLLNTFQWYPWPFSFVPVHYAVAWLLLGSLLLHVAVQWPRIRDHFTRRSPGTLALPEADGPDRRQLLAAVAAGVGAVTLTTVGQSVTALGPLDLFAPRSPAYGPQGLPVNRTAAAARVTRASLADWRLTLAGPRPAVLTLAELRALPQHEVTLPIACVEGWSKSARWTGVRVRDLLERAGGGPDARCRVVSLEVAGAYRVMEMGRLYAQDPLTLLALRLNGEVLSLDHGYPARIIAPNRPGVLQTKWVGRLGVA
ncbi:hypothetical protein Snoj_36290 [Streptomyces nojiriensis]|uniref:Oxidoreductase molybdopterin-binding domain-containing protein n=1 Tax=Streptomyces nojiriensis TaxID=66374 RepID=A0ABQ3SNJ3_9ACTN|nr:hypothetical protein GCM10010205_46660 [Streptomyces nojiriensis]GHI69711.1 hypothetical protein Snoj_36290 [Streptomyces nojiriensis]